MQYLVLSLFLSPIFLIAQSGYLLVKTNADCSILVDGEESVHISARKTHRFTLIPGTHLVEAHHGEQQKEEIIEIEANHQKLLILTFDESLDNSLSGAEGIQVLDPHGIYSFNVGNGLKGRAPLQLPNPVYNCQEEGELEFQFRIEPNGSVSYVRAVPTTQLCLKQAGINAIRKWKFSKYSGSEAQWVSVKIRFVLKG